MFRAVIVVAVSLLVIGCDAIVIKNYKVHYAFAESPEVRAPKKVLLLPSDITVGELSAGGMIEKVDDWSKQASSQIDSALRTALRSRNDFRVIEMPSLSKDEQERVEQYRALYDQVASAAFLYNGPGWEHKKDRFDYTLGNGVQFLKQRTGADAALFVVGQDRVSSGGRKTLAFMTAAFGYALHMGQSFVSAAIVDLNTGDVLWLNYVIKPEDLLGILSKDMRQADGATQMVRNVLSNYPGIDAMKKVKVAKDD